LPSSWAQLCLHGVTSVSRWRKTKASRGRQHDIDAALLLGASATTAGPCGGGRTEASRSGRKGRAAVPLVRGLILGSCKRLSLREHAVPVLRRAWERGRGTGKGERVCVKKREGKREGERTTECCRESARKRGDSGRHRTTASTSPSPGASPHVIAHPRRAHAAGAGFGVAQRARGRCARESGLTLED